MAEILRSVGLDVGTTSTQLIFSELTVENRAGCFSVPEMEIAQRKILYRSPIHFTPLSGTDKVDGAAIRKIIEAEYAAAGIRRDTVDTGAVIITGETSRKENAETVLRELSGFAGDFVVATAGPDLESVLAARGAGAVKLSAETGKTVLHMDIGGGTANLALIRNGKIIQTGCLNVGGRLIKYDKLHRVTYISPALAKLCSLKIGTTVDESDLEPIAMLLTQALEMSAGLREPNALLDTLTTSGTHFQSPGTAVTISFSGGVADCINQQLPWDAFGDLGPTLGQCIRRSRLCENYVLGQETIRATVIGAGCHSAQLSGSTVFHRNITFPLQNLPVLKAPAEGLADFLRREIPKQETKPVIALPPSPQDYSFIAGLADLLAACNLPGPLLLSMEQDMAKALGQMLALRLPSDQGILCIDRVRLSEDSYLDVGAPVGPALPVVVKTIVFNR